MQKRAIFPTVMFTFAAASFTFGGWQYFQARAVQTASQQRLAYVITTIEQSPVSRMQKDQLYATIMDGLPAAPGVLSLDVSGSFASPKGGDSCTSDGQRTVCRALSSQNAPPTVISAVCGSCNPR